MGVQHVEVFSCTGMGIQAASTRRGAFVYLELTAGGRTGFSHQCMPADREAQPQRAHRGIRGSTSNARGT